MFVLRNLSEELIELIRQRSVVAQQWRCVSTRWLGSKRVLELILCVCLTLCSSEQVKCSALRSSERGTSAQSQRTSASRSTVGTALQSLSPSKGVREGVSAAETQIRSGIRTAVRVSTQALRSALCVNKGPSIVRSRSRGRTRPLVAI